MTYISQGHEGERGSCWSKEKHVQTREELRRGASGAHIAPVCECSLLHGICIREKPQGDPGPRPILSAAALGLCGAWNPVSWGERRGLTKQA